MVLAVKATNVMLDEESSRILKREAKARGLSLSAFIRVIARELDGRTGGSFLVRQGGT